MMKKTYWNADATPVETTLDHVLYDLRREDTGGLLFDAVTMSDIYADADSVIILDALIVPFAKLATRMNAIMAVMGRAGTDIKPVSPISSADDENPAIIENPTISNPIIANGVANVVVRFELTDGQIISIFFHNPDVDPKKITATDDLISWKWMLNRLDITIVVAPEKGIDLNIRQVAVRVMKLAQKNSAAFLRKNTDKAEKLAIMEGLTTEIGELTAELKTAKNRLAEAKVEKDDREMAAVMPRSKGHEFSKFMFENGEQPFTNGFDHKHETLLQDLAQNGGYIRVIDAKQMSEIARKARESLGSDEHLSKTELLIVDFKITSKSGEKEQQLRFKDEESAHRFVELAEKAANFHNGGEIRLGTTPIERAIDASVNIFGIKNIDISRDKVTDLINELVAEMSKFDTEIKVQGGVGIDNQTMFKVITAAFNKFELGDSWKNGIGEYINDNRKELIAAAVTNPVVEPEIVNVDGLGYTPIDLNTDSAKQEWEKAISETNGNEFEAARNVYQKIMQGHYVNTSIGKVFISGSGWQEIKSGLKKDSLRAQTVPHIVEILKEGVVGAFDPNKKLDQKPNVTGYYPFTKTVEVDGKLVTALLKVEQKAKGEFVYHLRTSSDSTLDSTHENASLLRFMPDSLAFRELEEPTLDSIVEPNTGGVNIIILKVTDLEGNEIKELEDLGDEPTPIETVVPKTLPLEFSIKFEEFHTGSGKFGTAKLTQSDNGLSYDLIDNKGKKTQVWNAKIREMLASGEWQITEPAGDENSPTEQPVKANLNATTVISEAISNALESTKGNVITGDGLVWSLSKNALNKMIAATNKDGEKAYQKERIIAIQQLQELANAAKNPLIRADDGRDADMEAVFEYLTEFDVENKILKVRLLCKKFKPEVKKRSDKMHSIAMDKAGDSPASQVEFDGMFDDLEIVPLDGIERNEPDLSESPSVTNTETNIPQPTENTIAPEKLEKWAIEDAERAAYIANMPTKGEVFDIKGIKATVVSYSSFFTVSTRDYPNATPVQITVNGVNYIVAKEELEELDDKATGKGRFRLGLVTFTQKLSSKSAIPRKKVFPNEFTDEEIAKNEKYNKEQLRLQSEREKQQVEIDKQKAIDDEIKAEEQVRYVEYEDMAIKLGLLSVDDIDETSDDLEDYFDINEYEPFLTTAINVENSIRANNGVITWDDFSSSLLHEKSIFDSVTIGNVCAQFGTTDGVVTGRAEISKDGALTLYTGANGSNVSANVDDGGDYNAVNSAIAELFSKLTVEIKPVTPPVEVIEPTVIPVEPTEYKTKKQVRADWLDLMIENKKKGLNSSDSEHSEWMFWASIPKDLRPSDKSAFVASQGLVLRDFIALNKAAINTETIPNTSQSDTADIDAELKTLRGLIGTEEFKPAMNSLLDKLEADNNEEYDTVIGEIIDQHGAAKVASAKGV